MLTLNIDWQAVGLVVILFKVYFGSKDGIFLPFTAAALTPPDTGASQKVALFSLARSDMDLATMGSMVEQSTNRVPPWTVVNTPSFPA